MDAAPSPRPEGLLYTPYFKLSPRLTQFYATRGMWIDGEPFGKLAGMLGPRMFPEHCLFYVSPDQIRALIEDLNEHGPRGLTGQQVGQSIRRLRESLLKSGEPESAVPEQAASQPRPRANNPFAPLVVPANDRQRAAFTKHCFDSLRAAVDFQQTSAYGA